MIIAWRNIIALIFLLYPTLHLTILILVWILL